MIALILPHLTVAKTELVKSELILHGRLYEAEGRRTKGIITVDTSYDMIHIVGPYSNLSLRCFNSLKRGSPVRVKVKAWHP